MRPEIPFPNSTDCCSEDYSFTFLKLDECQFAYKEDVHITHPDGKPNEFKSFHITVFLALIHPDGIESGSSVIMPDYNQIAFNDPSGRSIKVFEVGSGHPILEPTTGVAFIENSFGEEQDDFVKDLRTLATSCKISS